MIKRLFIANRGEIARRIATTAARMGIESVAVKGGATPPAYLLGIVTDFVKVDDDSPATYLNGALMVKLAKDAGCDALHPGFGFLSENDAFAALVEKNGLVWIGPNPRAIEAMASKATARGHAEKAGVPCVQGLSKFPVPASEGSGDWTALEAFAAAAGYPLLMKAAYGGGGKGMRIVNAKSELREAALRASSEAKNSFDDGSLICEQYLTAPRHVEVQILADKKGTVLAIGDRDCSVQRRHQKIIEEAPAPALGPETRKALHTAAIRLAAAVGYDSTGTVEFLVDWSDEARRKPEQKFFFLEMNTRLQVEHPVTEEVFGIDLVEWQLRVASGEPLPESVKQAQPRGHSVEVRIYAEDVRQGFFPSPGPVAAFRPADGPGIRWEIGIDGLDRVTGRFDPMVAKLVATGESRAVALARLAEALGRTFFAGPACNIELLRELATRTAFAEGPVATGYLLAELNGVLAALDQRRAKHADDAAAVLSKVLGGQMAGGGAGGPGQDLFEVLTASAFSNNYSRMPADCREAAGAALTSSWQSAMEPTLAATSGSGLNRGGDGKLRAFWYALLKSGSERHAWVAIDGCTYEAQEKRVAREQVEGRTAGVDIVAPVPGKVIAMKVEAGAEVAAGQPVFVLESMKMEFEVKAQKAGRIAGIKVRIGEQVTAGQQLAHWDD